MGLATAVHSAAEVATALEELLHEINKVFKNAVEIGNLMEVMSSLPALPETTNSVTRGGDSEPQSDQLSGSLIIGALLVDQGERGSIDLANRYLDPNRAVAYIDEVSVTLVASYDCNLCSSLIFTDFASRGIHAPQAAEHIENVYRAWESMYNEVETELKRVTLSMYSTLFYVSHDLFQTFDSGPKGLANKLPSYKEYYQCLKDLHMEGRILLASIVPLALHCSLKYQEGRSELTKAEITEKRYSENYRKGTNAYIALERTCLLDQYISDRLRTFIAIREYAILLQHHGLDNRAESLLSALHTLSSGHFDKIADVSSRSDSMLYPSNRPSGIPPSEG
jgi:hypothetical protein